MNYKEKRLGIHWRCQRYGSKPAYKIAMEDIKEEYELAGIKAEALSYVKCNPQLFIKNYINIEPIGQLL